MTIREFFEANRDLKGRAWLDESRWIDCPTGILCAHGPSGAVLVAAEDELESARSAVGSLERDDPSPSGAEPSGSVSASDEWPIGNEQPAADQFDDFHGRGAWPGSSADDAEPSEFEDSIGDLFEEGVFDWDYEPDDEQ